MAFSVFSNNGRPVYGLKNFIVDTPSDIDNLSKDYTPGCMAFAISNSTYYMLNHQREWTKVQLANGGSSSGGGATPVDPTDYANVFYDGGYEE